MLAEDCALSCDWKVPVVFDADDAAAVTVQHAADVSYGTSEGSLECETSQGQLHYQTLSCIWLNRQNRLLEK